VDGTWIVEDLGSQNGVYVMGRRTGRNQLQDGWSLSIGGVPFVFHIGEVEVLS
jgi:pSer/pThr/pTyr-binding forkhead associated (FHA) protein